MTNPSEAASVFNKLIATFIDDYSKEGIELLENLSTPQATAITINLPKEIIVKIWEMLSSTLGDAILLSLDPQTAAWILLESDPNYAASALKRINKKKSKEILATMQGVDRQEIESLMIYPPNTAGSLMTTKMVVVHETATIKTTLERLQSSGLQNINNIFVVNEDNILIGRLKAHQLLFSKASDTIESYLETITACLGDLDRRDEIVEVIEKYKKDIIPVINSHGHIIGVIKSSTIFGSLQEDISTSMQAMVGVSKEEKPFSGILFSTFRRLPWLQINLLTAFLAASVVGLFESLIAQFTALAVLNPIVAGQAGNAGAQSLAVVMRGLALREITIRQWPRIILKELGTGLINGLSVALTCSAAVYLWSRSFGLTLVMFLSMTLALIIAGVSGALVPIILKRFGLDPAHSSSIILSTITDVVGFLSFLGIAAILVRHLNIAI